MPDIPEKFDLRSQELTEVKKQELLRLFPEIRTEGGQIDFDKLKLALGETVDVGRERYGMSWPGKADCFKIIQSPSLGTLRPCPEESVNFDTTENLIIEGDNLEVLKLLQKAYLGKVKLIYIDPPYNTGNDFIYPDNYTESLQTYLEYTGQVDAQGKKFGTNSDTQGRFHSRWLNMMYPRLYLARNLLRRDGVIFISIDDNEVVNLRKLCNEVFGEENFVASIIWQKKQSPQNDATYISDMHDYVLVYAKQAKSSRSDIDGWERGLIARGEEQEQRYKNPDNDPRGDWTSVDYTCNKTADERPNLFYGIKNPFTNEEIWPSRQRVWRFEKKTHLENELANKLWWGPDGKGFLRLKRFRSEVAEGIVPSTWWDRQYAGDNQESRREIRRIFPDVDDAFNTPKPTKLIKRILEISVGKDDDIVLDFFAGSGTTGHAVLDLNKKDNGRRKFILVQLPEPMDDPNYSTIAEITIERVRRVIKKLNDEDSGKLPLDVKQDRGFRVFKLAESNFKTWEAGAAQDTSALEKQLELHIQHLRPGRGSEDILFELLLKSSFPLTTPVEKITLTLAPSPHSGQAPLPQGEGKAVYSVAGGALLICLDGLGESSPYTLELVRLMAALKPERVVCLDAGFAGDDALKANAVQIFKSSGVTSFRTV